MTACAERMFPIQPARRGYPRAAAPLSVPWSVAEKAYAAYASRYGRSQSLDHLAERGGFGVEEMDDLHPGWRKETSEITRLASALAKERDLVRFADEQMTRLQAEADAAVKRVAELERELAGAKDVDLALRKAAELHAELCSESAAERLRAALAASEAARKEAERRTTEATTFRIAEQRAHAEALAAALKAKEEAERQAAESAAREARIYAAAGGHESIHLKRIEEMNAANARAVKAERERDEARARAEAAIEEFTRYRNEREPAYRRALDEAKAEAEQERARAEAAHAALRTQNDLALERLAEVERLRGALESAGKTATRLARSFRPGGAREAYVFKHDLDALASALASSTQTKGEQP